MEIGAIFPATATTSDHIELAEQLGYSHAFVFDSPSFLADPWMVLALAAVRTSKIALGVSVLTPRLRHVVATAGAAATLRALAPGRVVIVVGTGFTSQLMIGKSPATWKEVESYVTALRALLNGEEVEWDGSVIGLKHGSLTGLDGAGPVPIWVAAHGPKGYAAAERVADGILTNVSHGSQNSAASDARRLFVQFNGTVLEPGEDPGSDRVIDAAGATAAFQLHIGGDGVAAATPEWQEYERKIHAIDERRRHLETHRGHLIEVLPMERALISGPLILKTTETREAAAMRERVQEIRASGVAGLLYGPQGHDIARELRAFADVAQLTAR
jgi:5,10-methylenetetrahydromethanopterin reductase